ncbi:hypothetical protein [Pseudophaeobacter sp. EL27]|uniref:hypothetical protein n=1 Tax=Pseudophaeobacter sp. EL27 TaxID=2107580 RepID=UPI000EFD23E7|nr:hypothetical protein [Pseudophaeobacter sp. EL27]
MSSDREVIALDAWGDTLPDWITVLVQECDRSSQNAVAQKIAFSPAVVSQAIRNRYSGNMRSIESRVREVFMSAPVLCPALKTKIESAVCLQYRRRAETWTHGSPFRVKMIRACRACPKFNKSDEE